jgi:thiol-disulfide isomerase/thioredoxin
MSLRPLSLLALSFSAATSALVAQQAPAAKKANAKPEPKPAIITAALSYAAPVDGKPKPNFSPKGQQVPLTAPNPALKLPAGAVLPAKVGTMQLGTDPKGYTQILLSASAEFPRDLVQLWIDRNHNGDFTDDGAPLTTKPTLNEKTKAWWSTINKVEVSARYTKRATAEPYFVNFWSVREDSATAVDVIRFSTGSWRTGTVTVNGVNALVAAMDDNNAIFDKNDMWVLLNADAPDAEKNVLSLSEARATNRLMFLTGKDGADIPLEFRSFSDDGSTVSFIVVNRKITKATDRAPDDLVREERPRPRTETPVSWGKELPAALAEAKASGKQVLIDFEATWCGPCHTMDQWVWNDAELAPLISKGYVAIKVDADLQKELVKRLKITGYPTMMVMNADGTEVKRVSEYQSSKQMLAWLSGR